MSDKIVFDVAEVATLLRCEPSTVREEARVGRLPGIKFGKDWVFPLWALTDSLNLEARQLQELKSEFGPGSPTPVVTVAAGARVDRRTRPMPNLDAFTPVGGTA